MWGKIYLHPWMLIWVVPSLKLIQPVYKAREHLLEDDVFSYPDSVNHSAAVGS